MEEALDIVLVVVVKVALVAFGGVSAVPTAGSHPFVPHSCDCHHSHSGCCYYCCCWKDLLQHDPTQVVVLAPRCHSRNGLFWQAAEAER